MTAVSKVEVDLTGAIQKEEVHERLAEAFGFPDYYGKNWDAFWDCITTLDPMPRKIRIRGMKDISASLPREEAILRKFFVDLRTLPEAQAIELTIE